MDIYKTLNIVIFFAFIAALIIAYYAGEQQGFENGRVFFRRRNSRQKYDIPTKSISPKSRKRKKPLKIKRTSVWR